MPCFLARLVITDDAVNHGHVCGYGLDPAMLFWGLMSTSGFLLHALSPHRSQLWDPRSLKQAAMKSASSMTGICETHTDTFSTLDVAPSGLLCAHTVGVQTRLWAEVGFQIIFPLTPGTMFLCGCWASFELHALAFGAHSNSAFSSAPGGEC